jgi:predicted secreted protein
MHVLTSVQGLRHKARLGVIFAGLLLAASSVAHAAGDGSGHKNGAMATIEVSAAKEVLQDQVRVVFSAQAVGSTAAEVNRKLSDALNQARANFKIPAAVELSTGGFSVYLDYGKDNKPKGWAGRASLVVDSKALESVSLVIEHLGQSLAISSVQFSLSRDARREQQNLLMQDLAAEFAARAALAAQAFGFSGYHVVALDFTDGADFSARPTMQRMVAAPLMADAGPAVTLEPSMTSVEISVKGQIGLH